MKFDELTYTVAEMMGPPQQLTIAADRSARYESHSDAATPDMPEIGVYETRMPSGDFDQLIESLDQPAFASLSDHSGRIAAGDRYQRIVISSAAGTQEKIVGTTEPVDAALVRLIARLDQIVSEVMKHPKRTVRMTVQRAVIDASGTVTIDFDMYGNGTEATDLVNPVTLAGSSGLSIRGWPAKPPGPSQSGEGFGINADTVVEVGGASAGAPAAVLHIVPNQRRSFRATMRLRADGPQVYQTQLIYQNTTERPGAAHVLIGELVSRVFTLSVPAVK